MPPVVKPSESIDGGESLEIVGVLLRLAALLDRRREPAQQQQTENEAPRCDIDQLGHDEQNGIAERAADRRGKEPVLAAEKQTEINIFDDVAERIDGDHGEEQPRRSKDARVANIKDKN